MKLNIISISKGKKKNSARSKFFSSLMGKLAGDRGNGISEAFVDGDADKFRSEMTKIVNEIADSFDTKSESATTKLNISKMNLATARKYLKEYEKMIDDNPNIWPGAKTRLKTDITNLKKRIEQLTQ